MYLHMQASIYTPRFLLILDDNMIRPLPFQFILSVLSQRKTEEKERLEIPLQGSEILKGKHLQRVQHIIIVSTYLSEIY